MLQLQRYLFVQLLAPFGATLAGLTTVALLTQSLTQMDILIERGQSPVTLVLISLLAIPQFVAVIAPIALFAAVALAYNRLHQDNELVVGQSAGLSNWVIAEPAVRLAVLVMLGTLAINLFVQPFTYREMRDRLFEIRSDLATTLVREGQFRAPIPGLTIYAQRVDRAGGLSTLLVNDGRDAAGAVTYIARDGVVDRIEGQPAIVMRNGSLQRRNAQGELEIIGFATYILELGGYSAGREAVLYKPSDRYMHELLNPDMTAQWDRTHTGELVAEAVKRVASPFLALAAVALAMVALLGGAFSRKGYAGRLGLGATGLVLVLLASSALFPAFERNPALSPLLFVIPLLPVAWAVRKLRLFASAPERTPLGQRRAPIPLRPRLAAGMEAA
jgi:lipopolysaccharide export system permease protein